MAGNLFYFICSSPDDAPFSLKGGYSGTTSFILFWREGSNLQQFLFETCMSVLFQTNWKSVHSVM